MKRWIYPNYSASVLYALFAHFGIFITSYDWSCPPISGKLKLVEPKNIVSVCRKIIRLLAKELNPKIRNGGRPLFNEMEELKISNKSFRCKVAKIYLKSKREKYISFDNE